MNLKFRLFAAALIAVVAVFFLASTMVLACGKNCKPEDCKKACQVVEKSKTGDQTNATQVSNTCIKAECAKSCCPEKDKCCPGQDKSKCCPQGTSACCPTGGKQCTAAKATTKADVKKKG